MVAAVKIHRGHILCIYSSKTFRIARQSQTRLQISLLIPGSQARFRGRGGNVLRRLIDRSSALSIHRSFRMRLVSSPVSTCPKRSGWGSSWGPACNKCRPAHSTVSLFSISLTPLTETRSVWLPTGNPLSCAHCHIHCQLNARRCRRANHGRLNFCVPIRNICMRYVRAPSSSENGRKSRDGCVCDCGARRREAENTRALLEGG